MGLLVSPERKHDEGPIGFQFRLAASNLLSLRDLRGLEILGDFGSAPSTSPDTQVGMVIPTMPWVRRWSRFCPQCLHQRQCWLLGWEILFADACAECGSWLVDTCDGCGIQVSWRRAKLLQCICGRYLTEQKSNSAPPSVIRLSHALQRVAQGTPPVEIPVFRELSLVQCVRLVRLLGTYGHSHDVHVPQKVLDIDKLVVSWPISTMAAEILASWPEGLHSLLDSLQRRSDADEKGKLGRAFRGFYASLYKGFDEAEFDFLRHMFENYVADHWTGAIGKRNRRLDASVLENMAWIPANHACRLLSVSRRRLLSLIQDGSVRGEERMTSGQRKFVVVHKADAERLASTLDDGVPLLEAASRLRLKKQRLLALLPIICPEAKKLGVQGCPWAIPVQWIERWESLVNNQVAAVPLEGETVALGHLFRYWPWTTEQIGLLLVDILSGEVVPEGALKSTYGIGTLLLSTALLNQWVTSKQKAPVTGLTIPEVALRLGVKQEVAYSLVRSGFLQTFVRQVGRRATQMTGAGALEAFESRYIFGRDIARALGRSPRTTAEFLTAAGVLPVAGPGIDKCRQLIFLRDEVEACLQQDRMNVVK